MLIGHLRFRWVDCQLSEIRKCMKLSSLEKTLGALPTTLDATYDRILTNIDEEYVDDAIRVLQWLAFSARPMTVDEVAETLSICLDEDPRFDPDQRLKDPSDILVICSSLVTVSGTSHYDDDSMPELQSVSITTMSNFEMEEICRSFPKGSTLIQVRWPTQYEVSRIYILQLAHFSVKEYLVSSRIRNRPASRFAINRRFADTSIAQLCLVYLLHLEDFETLNDAQLECLPLAQYAADYWIAHARSDNGMIPDSLLPPMMDLFSLQRRMAFVNWARVFGKNPSRGCISAHYCGFGAADFQRRLYLSTSPNSIHSALCYANSLGLEEVLKQMLLDDNVPVDADAHACILVEASRRGFEAIVTILVGRGREFLEVCLKQASSSGRTALVNLLLDKGADVNGGGGAALQAASSAGHGQIVRLLIERGADINASGGAALRVAVNALGTSRVALVPVTLIQRSTGKTFQPQFPDHLEVARLLIERGADVNASGGAALNAALSANLGRAVHLLLSNGAKAHGQNSGLLWLQSDPLAAIYTLDKFRTALETRTASQLVLIEGMIPHSDDGITDNNCSEDIGEWELSEVESEEFTSTSDDLASSYRTAPDIDIIGSNIDVENDNPDFPNVSLDPASESETDAQLYRQYADKWEELVHRVRGLPGFHHFLLPSPISTLQMAAVEGPVMIINFSKYHCDAMIVPSQEDI